jgi:BMFP domain-containing protein YqiC
MDLVHVDLTVREIQVMRAVLLNTIQSQPKLQKEINKLENKLEARLFGSNQ